MPSLVFSVQQHLKSWPLVFRQKATRDFYPKLFIFSLNKNKVEASPPLLPTVVSLLREHFGRRGAEVLYRLVLGRRWGSVVGSRSYQYGQLEVPARPAMQTGLSSFPADHHSRLHMSFLTCLAALVQEGWYLDLNVFCCQPISLTIQLWPIMHNFFSLRSTLIILIFCHLTNFSCFHWKRKKICNLFLVVWSSS